MMKSEENLIEQRLPDRIESIIERRLLRDTSQGGYTSLTNGPPGSGKTSQLLYEADMFINDFPDEVIFWRNSSESAMQFNRCHSEYKIFAEKKCKLKFRDLMTGEILHYDYKTFRSFNELIDKDKNIGLARPGQLNVVFFKHTYRWIDFLKHLRRVVGWQTVFIDEIEDIIPLNPSKRPRETINYRMMKNLEFSNEAKQIRKGLVNLCGNTQAEDELDWRFKRKLNFMIYLRGARVNNASRVWQTMVDGLKMGECIIDWEYRMYGKSCFSAYPPKKPVFEVIIS